MNFNDFELSFNNDQANSDWPVELQALWLDKNGFWNEAHELIQWLPGKGPARIHAYLHRKEGDNCNANYWYSQTDDQMPSFPSEQEWLYLVEKFVNT